MLGGRGRDANTDAPRRDSLEEEVLLSLLLIELFGFLRKLLVVLASLGWK